MDHQDWDSWNDDLPADASGGDAGGEPSADLGAEGLGGPDLAGLSGEVDLSGEVEDPDPLGEVPAGVGFDGSDQRPPEEPLGLDLPAADDPDTPWATEPPTQGAIPVEHLLVGVDPDLATSTDDPAWAETAFPEPLTLAAPPEPVDGFPWSDPAVLGDPTAADTAAWFAPQASVDATEVDATDLAGYAATELPAGQDPWAGLIGSDDPATSTLARWWAPGGW